MASYARRNAFGVLVAYSGDSSHILLGNVQNRKLLEIGVLYNRRLWRNRAVNWQYSAEFLPVALESDPLQLTTYTQTQPVQVTYSTMPTAVYQDCRPASGSYSNTYTQTGGGTITYTGTYEVKCKNRWTMGEAISPVGFQWNFRPHHTVQPFLVGHGGYMFSTREIPVDQAGAFNFTFDGGAGLEVFHSKTRSIRLEYRYHHISNHNTATVNPGIDNSLFQMAYVFGR